MHSTLDRKSSIITLFPELLCYCLGMETNKLISQLLMQMTFINLRGHGSIVSVTIVF